MCCGKQLNIDEYVGFSKKEKIGTNWPLFPMNVASRILHTNENTQIELGAPHDYVE